MKVSAKLLREACNPSLSFEEVIELCPKVHITNWSDGKVGKIKGFAIVCLIGPRKGHYTVIQINSNIRVLRPASGVKYV